jgi:hypothetical protein
MPGKRNSLWWKGIQWKRKECETEWMGSPEGQNKSWIFKGMK